jgi:uncharacterized protein
MAFNIGLNVIEVDGSAPATIAGAATSVGAFNVATRRGPANQPVRVTSFAQFVERFGGFDAASLGAYLVKGFFDNGGRRAWINRVGGGGVAAAVVKRSSANNAGDLLRFEAGFRGSTEAGTWGNGLEVTLAPSFVTKLRDGETVGKGGTKVVSVAGFSEGDVIVLTEGNDRAVVTVQTLNAVSGEITWSPDIANNTDFEAAATQVASADLDLAVNDGTTAEAFPRLTMKRSEPNYAPLVVNDRARGSKLVVVTDARAANQSGAEGPGVTVRATLANGASTAPGANDYSGDAAAHTGWFAFDPLEVNLVACDRSDASIVNAALAYCEGRGDCMFIGAVPEASVGGGTAIDYGAQFQGKNVYGALYGPWITVADPLSRAVTPVRSIPPTGHVMGVYARTETQRGIHKAPAGDGARLLGALDVEYRLSDADHTDLVKTGSVNGIRVVPGAGIVVDASRTLSTDTRWIYVNVRLLFNYVKSSLKQGLRWVRQEPNRDTLWTSVKHGSVTPFLLGLWRQGAFGTGEPADVFTVICDATNNPPEEVDKGNFKVEVYFYPSKPAETIVIVVGQQASGGSAAES